MGKRIHGSTSSSAQGGATNSGRRRGMEEWLDLYPPSEVQRWDEDTAVDDDVQRSAETRRELLAMAPQAVLDLHGLTSDEAGCEINRFLQESVDAGLRKVIIVHGKGNHSPGGGILSRVTVDCVSKHPLAGENALARGTEGGRGARWVILRQRSR